MDEQSYIGSHRKEGLYQASVTIKAKQAGSSIEFLKSKAKVYSVGKEFTFELENGWIIEIEVVK